MNENRRRPNRQPVYRAPIFLFRNFKVLINNSRESSLDESQGGQKWESATRADKYLHAQRGIVRTHCRMYATGMCVSAFSFSLFLSLALSLSTLPSLPRYLVCGWNRTCRVNYSLRHRDEPRIFPDSDTIRINQYHVPICNGANWESIIIIQAHTLNTCARIYLIFKI